MNVRIRGIYDWLMMAFSKKFIGWLGETFYYDKRDNQFYPVHFMDMLLLNEDKSFNKSHGISYSDATARLLAERILRQENGDINTIKIPYLNIEERQNALRVFAGSVEDDATREILYQRARNQDGTNYFDAYLDKETNDELKEKWETFKRKVLIQKIEPFLNEHSIDVNTATILDLEQNLTIKIDLTE